MPALTASLDVEPEVLLAARSAARLQPSRTPSPAPLSVRSQGRADGFPPRSHSTTLSRSTSGGNSCVSGPDGASVRTNRVASFSWSLQARGEATDKARESVRHPEDASEVAPRSTRLGGPPARSPVDAHSGSRRAISPQRYISAASLRGGHVGRLRAGRRSSEAGLCSSRTRPCATRLGRANGRRGWATGGCGCEPRWRQRERPESRPRVPTASRAGETVLAPKGRDLRRRARDSGRPGGNERCRLLDAFSIVGLDRDLEQVRPLPE